MINKGKVIRPRINPIKYIETNLNKSKIMINKDITKIKEREILLTKAQDTLKKEFIGIDNVIDDIISNIRVWYLFPEMVSRPLVINLWGLTGCGKTSLVTRLCELLDVNDRTIMYNLAKLEEDSSSELEDSITENIPNCQRNPVFVFDEFQFAATKAEDGKEKDNKTALKTIWELIDSGMFRAKLERYVISDFMSLMFLSSIMDKSGVTVKNGKLLGVDTFLGTKPSSAGDKNDEIMASPSDLKPLVSRYFNHEGKDELVNDSWCEAADKYIKNEPEYWVSCQTVSTLYNIWNRTVDDSTRVEEFTGMLNRMTMKEFMDLIYRLETKSKGGYYHDYSGSLVFVIGNVDEAYTMSYDMNPDMDADQFNELTKKLSMVDIKEALRERFRNEQIARLGNIMLIYPSFSPESFTNIIRLNQYKERVLNNFGIRMDFDKSIVDVIYKDGVFPTQGTRPVFSSIYEIVETKLPRIVLQAYDDNVGDIDSIRLSYSNNKVVGEITYKESKDSKKTVEFDQELKIEDLRKNKHDERQALVAVHESMHFVMYAKLFGKMPDKLVSNCASGEANGFMMEKTNENHFLSKSDYLKNIQVSLAGYVAEKYVFGDDEYTSGASSDLVEATTLASRMVRSYGMTSELVPCVYTYLISPEPTNGGMLMNDKEAEQLVSSKITEILDVCELSVKATLEDPEWYNMFNESSQYLFENVSMPKEKMREIYEHVSEEKRKECVRDENYFRNKLKNL